MTLLLTEGFDWLQTADMPTAYGAFGEVQPQGSMTDTIETGRNGGKALQIIPGAALQDADAWRLQGKTFPIGIAPGAEVIVGFAFKFTVLPYGKTTFCGIQNSGGTGNNTYNVNLYVHTTGVLMAGKDGDGPTVFAGCIGTTVIRTGAWYFVEMKFVSHNSAGVVEVRLNGIPEFSATGLDTQATDNQNVTLNLGAQLPSGAPTVLFDDVYICDDAGTTNNDFLGDLQIQTITPDGNGNTSNMLGSDANSVDNYLHVDDAGAIDDDTSYVADSVSANKDTYTYSDTANLETVYGVNVKTIARKEEGGSPDILAVARSVTTEVDSLALGFTTEYIMRQAIFEEDPDNPTSPEWTPATVNAAEFGVKIE